MIFIGESINTSIKPVKEAVLQKDAAYIRRLAKAQADAGAAYLDVNCGNMVDNEPELMEWLVRQVREEVALPLSIDSPRPEAMDIGLSLAGDKPIMNSITAERERFQILSPMIGRYGARVIALLMDDTGMPASAEDRIRIARELIPRLLETGMNPDDIIVDPIVKPIGTGDSAGQEVFGAIRTIASEFPDVHFSVGLSNISHGLPMDAQINHAFLLLCMASGLDVCIANVLDPLIPGYAACAEALLGRDPYCGRLLKLYRKGQFPEKMDTLDL